MSEQRPLVEAFHSTMRTIVDPETYALWIEPLEPVAISDHRLVLAARNRFALDYLRAQLGEELARAQRALGLELELCCDERSGTKAAPTAPRPRPEGQRLHPELNAKYTFETFVPGSSNQFAHAASLAISERPGERYNPLFIYGGVGLGKTHLLHAIGHTIYGSGRTKRVVLVSAEQFMNEVVAAIRNTRITDLRNRYRNQCDVLLIDDIQFISGKERTQVEFFHIFNTLYERGRQIVFTSDRPPKEIVELEERLRSRFESGLIADIQPPEFEHRLAILHKKAAAMALDVRDEVLEFIATYIVSNVRELEGALTRLSARAAFEGRPIDLDYARNALSDLITFTAGGVSVDRIQKLVAEFFQIKVSDLRGKSRKKNIVYPRQIAMFLCRRLTNLSYPEIGQRFGGRDHTTVMHAIAKIERLLAQDAELNSLVDTLTRTLERRG